MVILIGPLPPPVHGMSKNFLLFKEEVEKHQETKVFNTSPGNLERNLSYHFRKALNFIKNMVGLIYVLLNKRNQVRFIYMPPDGGLGSYYSLFYIIVSALFDKKIFLHHRSFNYVRNKFFVFNIISRFFNHRVKHIFLCDCMAFTFQDTYGISVDYSIISNAMHVDDNELPVSLKERDSQSIIQFGYLSNVSFEKGIVEAIQLFENFNLINTNSFLTIAGPFESKEVEAYILDYIALSANITYVGPLYGVDKANFYKKIDIFLFPTRYRNEAQPNVLFEAAINGAIPISTPIGCIGSDLKSIGGNVSSTSSNFVKESLDYLLESCSDLDSIKYQSHKISEAMKLLSSKSLIEYKKFIKEYVE